MSDLCSYVHDVAAERPRTEHPSPVLAGVAAAAILSLPMWLGIIALVSHLLG